MSQGARGRGGWGAGLFRQESEGFSMNKLIRRASLVAFFIAASAAPALSATCAELSSALKLPNVTVTMAQDVAAGAFTAPAARGGGGRGGGPNYSDLPAFCRVAATLKPTPESDIKMEIWLPATGWNGKFQMTGNGGWNGNVDINAIAAGLRRGYATASTDTGHEGGGGPWMANREKWIDYGHRAVHETTVVSKALVNAFYGNAPRFSYFTGCSAGGRQALKAAQMYPADFDGIVAGAPAASVTGRAAFATWIAQQNLKTPESFIPPAKYPAINNAVLDACDALDGATDRLIENPRACKFDPQVLACKAGDADTCLTAAQVETARVMYQPLVNPRTRAKINNQLEYGSELGWATFGGQQPFGVATQMYQNMVFKNPAWDYKTLNFDADWAATEKAEGGIINALDPNLKPFISRGGKLIQYHGWSDPQIPTGSSVDYYESVVKAMGGRNAIHGGYRMFMVPGMAHCGGGTGTSTFDMLAALENWVEKKTAPDAIPASRVANGQTNRTRPLCPYPQVASYKGSGSMDDAANFSCK
jgi:feruloyl esterase